MAQEEFCSFFVGAFLMGVEAASITKSITSSACQG